MSKRTKHTELQNINYEEHCGVEDKSQDSFFGLPVIRLCVGFFKYNITKINARTDLAPFLKKMKLKPFHQDYAVLMRAMKDTNTHMHLALQDKDNIQVQADLFAQSRRLAETCQGFMIKYKLNPPVVQAEPAYEHPTGEQP
jgi:hypothetical protein